MSQAVSSPFSYILAIALFVSSYFWLDYGGDSMLELRAWLSGSSDQVAAIAVPEARIEKKKSYKELLLEVKELRREVHKYRKLKNEDLDFLIAEVIGSFYRLNKNVSMINLGRDYGVKKGDIAVQGDYVVGRVIEIADTCSLVETSTSPFANFFVRFKDIKDGEYIWIGKGKNNAIVQMSESSDLVSVGDKVFLSASRSLGGKFLLGQVVKISNRTQKGWRELSMHGKEINPTKTIMIIKETERKNVNLFVNKDELSELKKKVKELELIKLRLELSKN
jgi:cell shape-determining protein MreC